MSETAEAIVLAVLILATSVWVGGYVAIVVVARAATATLDQTARVAFFRSLGRLYFWVGVPALVVALFAGGLLARDADATGEALFAVIVVVAVVLLASFAVAVVQARRMTRLRLRLLESPTDEVLRAQVARGARAAGALRGVLGILSIALVMLGTFLAV